MKTNRYHAAPTLTAKQITNTTDAHVLLDCQDRVEPGGTFHKLRIDNGFVAWVETVCAEHLDEAVATGPCR